MKYIKTLLIAAAMALSLPAFCAEEETDPAKEQTVREYLTHKFEEIKLGLSQFFDDEESVEDVESTVVDPPEVSDETIVAPDEPVEPDPLEPEEVELTELNTVKN